jgi:ribonuclease J
MARVTLYGGVAEIGGNKVLIEDKDAKIFLDFGMSLGARSSYFADPYSAPRSERSLLELGILPKLSGFYRWDGEPEVDAVVLSHAHLDHYGYLSMMNRRVPVHCGETAKLQMEAIRDSRRGGFESDYKGLEYRTFRTGAKVKIGPITVTPVHVDHSIPGAYGLIVDTSDGTLVYTGDLRAHGRMAAMTKDFALAAAKSHPDVMLCEGTNMVGASVSSEAEVERKLQVVIGRSSGLVVASFSTMDSDRLKSFYEAARASDKRLILSMRQAFMLSRLSRDRVLDMPSVKKGEVSIYKRHKKRYDRWEEEVCSEGETLTAGEIAKDQGRYVLAAGLSDMEALLEVKPWAGSAYILSSSEPFNEEMELDLDRLHRWLDELGMVQYHVHVSGHALPQDLEQLVKDVSPGKLVPMHTEHPDLFRKFVAGGATTTQLPVAGTAIEIGRVR